MRNPRQPFSPSERENTKLVLEIESHNDNDDDDSEVMYNLNKTENKNKEKKKEIEIMDKKITPKKDKYSELSHYLNNRIFNSPFNMNIAIMFAFRDNNYQDLCIDIIRMLIEKEVFNGKILNSRNKIMRKIDCNILNYYLRNTKINIFRSIKEDYYAINVQQAINYIKDYIYKSKSEIKDDKSIISSEREIKYLGRKTKSDFTTEDDEKTLNFAKKKISEKDELLNIIDTYFHDKDFISRKIFLFNSEKIGQIYNELTKYERVIQNLKNKCIKAKGIINGNVDFINYQNEEFQKNAEKIMKNNNTQKKRIELYLEIIEKDLNQINDDSQSEDSNDLNNLTKSNLDNDKESFKNILKILQKNLKKYLINCHKQFNEFYVNFAEVANNFLNYNMEELKETIIESINLINENNEMVNKKREKYIINNQVSKQISKKCELLESELMNILCKKERIKKEEYKKAEIKKTETKKEYIKIEEIKNRNIETKNIITIKEENEQEENEKEEIKKEENKKEETKKEENENEETKKEEIKKEENENEETKKEETKKEENENEETKKEENKNSEIRNEEIKEEDKIGEIKKDKIKKEEDKKNEISVITIEYNENKIEEKDKDKEKEKEKSIY